MRTIIIELRVDNEKPEADDILIDAAKMAAKHLFTSACLISGKRKPQITLQSGDMFVAAEEINLADDIE